MKSRLIIQDNDAGRRVDRILRKLYPQASLGLIFKAFRKGWIKINGKKVGQGQIPNQGDELIIFLPIDQAENQPDIEIPHSRFEPTPPETILFQNHHILAINKPRGKTSHGAGSLLEDIMDYLKSQSKDSLSWEPGPVNRLDRNTSGCLFYSLSLKGASELSRIIKQRQCRKYYLALMTGKLEADTWIDWIDRDRQKKISFKAKPHQGKKAETQVWPLISNGNQSLVLCRITTGLTHQIRIQAKIHQHPLKGDRKYNPHTNEPGFFLHAFVFQLDQENPFLNFKEITAPLPSGAWDYLQKYWDKKTIENALIYAEKIYRSGA